MKTKPLASRPRRGLTLQNRSRAGQAVSLTRQSARYRDDERPAAQPPGGGRPKPKPGVAPLEPQKRIVDALGKALDRAEKTEDVELAIGVIDEADPHLCWLVSSRDPEELVRAIEDNRPSGVTEPAEHSRLD